MPLDYEQHLMPAYDRVFPGRPRPDADQRDGITRPGNAVFLVAGPGSGKTTVLALRVLEQIYCRQVPPHAVLATTFTVKAAAELRSRLLAWGSDLQKGLLADSAVGGPDRTWVESVDVNQVTTGTLDSICNDVLRQHRPPAMQPPILIDEFLAKTVLVRSGLFLGGRYLDHAFDSWLKSVDGGSGFGWNLGRKREVLASIWDRLQQDLTDVAALAASGRVPAPAQAHLVGALTDYRTELDANHWLDFGMLGRRVLDGLRAGELDEWATRYRSVLVDEYQDTNLLQEQIYFELVGRGGAELTVVGDDDQALYRFRGAAVELFRDFPSRLKSATGRTAATVFLRTNYRSTDAIVDFANTFITRDPAFQPARVSGKPRITGTGRPPALAILGLFRPTTSDLASAVAAFVTDVCGPRGAALPNGDRLQLDRVGGGNVGDVIVLASSPAEFKRLASRPGATPERRFPGLLREELGYHKIQVFNPRGAPLGDVAVVRQLGGLLLEALDDRGLVQAADATQKRLGQEAQRLLPEWRNDGRIKQRSIPDLSRYVSTWQARSTPAGHRWPSSVPVLQLLYGLVHFLPEFHDDPEGQVYLEVFTRQLTAMSAVSGFEGRVVTTPANPTLSEASVRDLLCDWLAPIANGTVELDEEMVGSFPRDRLSILSIHQSKGLEFPMVIVDVGSDLKKSHWAQAFKRYPTDGAMSHTLEDLIRPLSGLGPAPRSPKDRAFDDLERLYYVAFTRPQQALMLVGLDGVKPRNAVIPNVPSGWDRAGTRHGASWPVSYL